MITYCSKRRVATSGNYIALVALTVGLPLSVLAQETKKSPSSGSNPANQKWDELQAHFLPPAAGEEPVVTDEASQARAKEWHLNRFVRAAVEAKSFSETFPESEHAKEALYQEAKNSLQAAMAGDSSRESRAREILGQIRTNGDLPAKALYELAVLAEIVRLRPLSHNPVKFLPAYEAALRALIDEFPEEAGGYDRLLRFAEHHPEELEMVRIARDVTQMSAAPSSSKTTAETIVGRQALVGQSLVELLRPFLQSEGSTLGQDGRGIVLYIWSARNPGSLEAVHQLAKNSAEQAHLIGINLDRDDAAARAAAQTAGLTGEQIYDARGLAGPLAQALKLTRETWEVYVADSKGVLRTVSAQRGDLSTKLGYALAAGR